MGQDTHRDREQSRLSHSGHHLQGRLQGHAVGRRLVSVYTGKRSRTSAANYSFDLRRKGCAAARLNERGGHANEQPDVFAETSEDVCAEFA